MIFPGLVLSWRTLTAGRRRGPERVLTLAQIMESG
jgi:hypothetical protein